MILYVWRKQWVRLTWNVLLSQKTMMLSKANGTISKGHMSQLERSPMAKDEIRSEGLITAIY